MRWFRRSSTPALTPATYLFDEDFLDDVKPGGEPVEIVGIGWHEKDSLYQFETLDGTYVTLHDVDCAEIAFRPADRVLTLSFTHPSGPDPVLTLRFDDAVVLRWHLDRPLGPRRHAGQVSDLWWDNAQMFALYALNDEIAFTAARLTVTTTSFPDLRS